MIGEYPPSLIEIMTIFENFLRISGQSDTSLDLFLNIFTLMAPLDPTNEIIRQVWVGAGPMVSLRTLSSMHRE